MLFNWIWSWITSVCSAKVIKLSVLPEQNPAFWKDLKILIWKIILKLGSWLFFPLPLLKSVCLYIGFNLMCQYSTSENFARLGKVTCHWQLHTHIAPLTWYKHPEEFQRSNNHMEFNMESCGHECRWVKAWLKDYVLKNLLTEMRMEFQSWVESWYFICIWLLYLGSISYCQSRVICCRMPHT